MAMGRLIHKSVHKDTFWTYRVFKSWKMEWPSTRTRYRESSQDAGLHLRSTLIDGTHHWTATRCDKYISSIEHVFRTRRCMSVLAGGCKISTMGSQSRCTVGRFMECSLAHWA